MKQKKLLVIDGQGGRMGAALVSQCKAAGLGVQIFRCQGEELTVNGKTAQDFLDGQLTITRTVETDYRE